MDDTLLGDDAALARLDQAVRRAPHVLVALDSARRAADVIADVAAAGFSRITAAAGALGTELIVAGAVVTGWQQRFAGWSRRPVDEVLASLGFSPHSADQQTPYKASFAVPRADGPAVVAELERRSIPATVVHSGDSDFDVLPPGAGKAPVLTHLADRLGVDPSRVIAAGDSGNDRDMLLSAARAIVVGNATQDLADLDGDGVYRARAGHAAGILEGLAHFRVPLTTPVA